MTMRARETTWSRFVGWIQDRGVMVRLGLAALAMLLLLLVLKAWQAPFTHRIGNYSADGIAAKTGFDRVDEEATNVARRAAEQAVPLVFNNSTEDLLQLPDRLRAALGEVSQAESLETLPAATRADFGLGAVDTTKPMKRAAQEVFKIENPRQQFAALKEAVSGMGMGDKSRIDDMVADFSKFISPLAENGLLNHRSYKNLQGNLEELEPDRKILVVDVHTGAATEVLVPKVSLADQLNEAGDLGGKWLSYPSLTKPIQQALSHWLMCQAKPTLEFDQAATKEAQAMAGQQVDSVYQRFLAGDLIVRPGEFIDEKRLEILTDEYEANEKTIGIGARLLRLTVVFLMMSILASLNAYYIVHNEPRIVRSMWRLMVFLVAIVATAALARPMSYDPWRAEIIPLLVTVMVLAVAYNQVIATLAAFSISLALTFSTTGQFGHFVVLISTCAAAVIPVSRVGSRSTLIKVSVFAAVTHFIVSTGVGVIQSQSLTDVFQDRTLLYQSLTGVVWCLFAGYFVAGSLPFIEQLFGVVTDISLLELSDPSHPLLQELVRRAPGTYNHSIAVASIAETAAEAIGANGLLVRVGAYFHDIGKMLKPQYFIENISAGTESRHQQLAPAMSTLIIIGHVKDGVDLAEEHNLPQPLIDFIEQHHGTTLVEYFFHEATKAAENRPDHRTDAEESSFRYPGPKPQTREAGVLMLADAVEGASRTLTDPTPKRIETLVHNITLKRLLDGQFDESSLKLSEIRTVEASLVKSLIAIYHGRIRYPEARTA
jgi:putative nucleotidyltransferase with HDIG domain